MVGEFNRWRKPCRAQGRLGNQEWTLGLGRRRRLPAFCNKQGCSRHVALCWGCCHLCWQCWMCWGCCPLYWECWVRWGCYPVLGL